MKQIDFYLDFISPYAYLAFEKLPEALMGISYRLTHKPVLFAGLLKHHGQLGPAEIAPKRDWTYRQVLWLAHTQGVDLQMPASHPFNPLVLLRLAVACDPRGEPNRHVCETIFHHVWLGGEEATDPARVEALTGRLAPVRPVDDPAVKDALRGHAEAALALGVFGVPAFVVDDKVFWGFDALPMLRAYLLGDPWFHGDGWDSVSRVGAGLARR